MMSTLLPNLRQCISEQLIPLDDSFTNDDDLYLAGVDSMAMMQLILLIEQEFGIRIEPGDLGRENFQSLQAIGALIERKRVEG